MIHHQGNAKDKTSTVSMLTGDFPKCNITTQLFRLIVWWNKKKLGNNIV